jgi:hypothetical protein
MDRYAAVLDVFSLTSLYPDFASVLATRTQREALRFLETGNATKLSVLLRIAADLGYIDDEASIALTKLLNKA